MFLFLYSPLHPGNKEPQTTFKWLTALHEAHKWLEQLDKACKIIVTSLKKEVVQGQKLFKSHE